MFSQIYSPKHWSGLCASITDIFFRSLIYSTMLSENVRPERLSHIHFINGLGKIGKGLGVSRGFYFMSGGPTPINRTYTKSKMFSFLYIT